MYYYPPVVNQYDWAWNVGFSIFWFIFFILIIALCIRMFRRHTWRDWYHDYETHDHVHDHHHGAETTDPLAIAKERYARGDITKEQFEQLKKDLKD